MGVHRLLSVVLILNVEVKEDVVNMIQLVNSGKKKILKHMKHGIIIETFQSNLNIQENLLEKQPVLYVEVNMKDILINHPELHFPTI